MSNGLFQNLPGAHEMGSANALPNEPWLLPISDAIATAPTSDDLMAGVQSAARPFRIAANALGAALALLLTAQMTMGWVGSGPHPATGQVADATPPTLAVEKAALTVEH